MPARILKHILREGKNGLRGIHEGFKEHLGYRITLMELIDVQ